MHFANKWLRGGASSVRDVFHGGYLYVIWATQLHHGEGADGG